MSDKIRTRFAPSPTGHLHIGGLRTAIYAYALAKHSKGDFVLRIEDTDQNREVEGSREKIESLLKLFGLIWDGDIEVQSKRVGSGIYEKAAKALVASGHAFYCDCKPKNAKTDGYSETLRDPCRDKGLKSGAIKLKVQDDEQPVNFKDYVLNKEVSWDASDVSDATLLKSDGFPTYHLAVVVDDHDMSITHVLRGHDWMPSTPIHLLVYKYLGYDKPEIGHLTDILDPEGGKLSKRKGSTSVEGMLSEGYLPSALLNFVILLGWAPRDDRELFTLPEFVETFDPRGFQKSNPTFDRVKLDWFNGEYLRKLSVNELSAEMSKHNKQFEDFDKNKKFAIAELLQTRITNTRDINTVGAFFFTKPQYSRDTQNGLNMKHLKNALSVLEGVDDWTKDNINSKFLDLIDKNHYKTGDFFMDLRIAITGVKFTPPITESIVILGKKDTLERLSSLL